MATTTRKARPTFGAALARVSQEITADGSAVQLDSRGRDVPLTDRAKIVADLAAAIRRYEAGGGADALKAAGAHANAECARLGIGFAAAATEAHQRAQ